jgi:hypothetical protein
MPELPSSVRVSFDVPATSAEPVELSVAYSPLRMVLVGRDAVRRLDDGWKQVGIYFLLGPSSHPERYRVYVGEVGKRTLLLRLKEHAAGKSWWNRALLVTSDRPDFHSAAIGWLEGRLYDALNNALLADVENSGKPGDNSLAASDQGALEYHVVHPIMAALRACGVSLDTADQKPPPKGRKRKHYTESVADLIDAGLLRPGTVLQPLRGKVTQTATVMADGRLQVGTASYDSVSGAAKAVSGKQAEPGWEFWRAPSGDGGFVSLFELRAHLREGANPELPPKTPAVPQEGLPKGPSAAAPPPSDRPLRKVTFADLVKAGVLPAGSVLVGRRERKGQTAEEWKAEVQEDGRLLLAGQAQPMTPGRLADEVTGTSVNAWLFWQVERDGSFVRVAALRDRLRKSTGQSSPS